MCDLKNGDDDCSSGADDNEDEDAVVTAHSPVLSTSSDLSTADFIRIQLAHAQKSPNVWITGCVRGLGAAVYNAGVMINNMRTVAFDCSYYVVDHITLLFLCLFIRARRRLMEANEDDTACEFLKNDIRVLILSMCVHHTANDRDELIRDWNHLDSDNSSLIHDVSVIVWDIDDKENTNPWDGCCCSNAFKKALRDNLHVNALSYTTVRAHDVFYSFMSSRCMEGEGCDQSLHRPKRHQTGECGAFDTRFIPIECNSVYLTLVGVEMCTNYEKFSTALRAKRGVGQITRVLTRIGKSSSSSSLHNNCNAHGVLAVNMAVSQVQTLLHISHVGRHNTRRISTLATLLDHACNQTCSRCSISTDTAVSEQNPLQSEFDDSSLDIPITAATAVIPTKVEYCKWLKDWWRTHVIKKD